jgi:hypothetical protein
VELGRKNLLLLAASLGELGELGELGDLGDLGDRKSKTEYFSRRCEGRQEGGSERASE